MVGPDLRCGLTFCEKLYTSLRVSGVSGTSRQGKADDDRKECETLHVVAP
jgi:hypothetical protein